MHLLQQLEDACAADKFDVILVPGGGSQRSADAASLPAWTLKRLDAAIAVWKAHGGVEMIMPLSGGTPHKPNYIDEHGFQVFESTSAARYLISQGVPPEKIVREFTSYDTIGNAFFARVQHTDITGWRKLLIITSDFHMPRSIIAFNWIFGLEPPADPYMLYFLAVADEGLDDEALTARATKEQSSCEALQRTIASLPSQTLKAVHQWLYTEHKAYATQPLMITCTDRALPESLSKTY